MRAWCETCRNRQQVDEATVETVGEFSHAVTYAVQHLACGHTRAVEVSAAPSHAGMVTP